MWDMYLFATISALWAVDAVVSGPAARSWPSPRAARSRLTRHSTALPACFSVAASTATTYAPRHVLALELLFALAPAVPRPPTASAAIVHAIAVLRHISPTSLERRSESMEGPRRSRNPGVSWPPTPGLCWTAMPDTAAKDRIDELL